MANGDQADHPQCGTAGRRDRVAALLELAAADDAAGFKAALDAAGGAELADEVELWRRGQSKPYEPRTPLMVAASCGSAAVVALLLGLGRAVDVNHRPGVDGATALHCAASGGAPNAAAVVAALLAAGADRAVAPTPRAASPPTSAYASDEFRMFGFKVQPCARTYAHDWTECPFVHPGENARRRDPRRHAYTAVPCASFRRHDGGGCCPRGDACDFAHGVFESWLHPSQYRTRMCREGAACARRICFFAHADHELRHVPRDGAGAGVLSPRAMDDVAALGLLLPPAGSPTGNNGGGLAAHWLQQGTARRLHNSFDPSLLMGEQHVDELGAILDLVSLSQSQPRLSSIRQSPAISPASKYMTLPPSRFGDDHGGSVYYSPEAAETSLLLAKIRQRQGVRLPPIRQATCFNGRSPLRRASNCNRCRLLVDWSFNAQDLLQSP
ncbi:hypothetical protein PR202_ga31165 [Eleusine coracana subsp. coracana]|uniref:C3H1-type domain-containing protein n=1 Tax=Eleusine coracana subsp. coracana TaxID=191504 RepID=A0AAV5DRH5_ELECO|nr:hypothetical protein PR202_ga31165 [Eleusine coracana subsp. coracana]